MCQSHALYWYNFFEDASVPMNAADSQYNKVEIEKII